MKARFALILLVVSIAVLLTACMPKLEAEGSKTVNDPSCSSNWEYVSLGSLPGTVSDNQVVIGQAILKWEAENPDREIVSLQIIFQQHAYTTREVVFGISVYSKLK